MGETMFEKDKPKKELTDKQKKALATGRKKLKAKRQAEDIEVANIKTRQREERQHREMVLDEKKEIEIYNRLMKKGNEKIERFKQQKYNWLDKAKNVKEYSEFKSVLDTITEEDILHDKHIDKLKESLSIHTRKKSPEPEPEPELDENSDDEARPLDLDDVVNVY